MTDLDLEVDRIIARRWLNVSPEIGARDALKNQESSVQIKEISPQSLSLVRCKESREVPSSGTLDQFECVDCRPANRILGVVNRIPTRMLR